MSSDLIGALIDTCAAAIVTHAEELTQLDAAIGDGDHGVNMRRGFDAIGELRGELAEMPAGAALQKAGMTLVMKVGGASGPLYGSLLMGIGKALGGGLAPDDVAPALRAGVESVKQRGKSDVGDKTMLDVLVPVTETLEGAAGAEVAWTPELLEALRAAARAGLEATRPLQARKGRASFLGERSVGHLDPGARSSQLLVETLCSRAGGES